MVRIDMELPKCCYSCMLAHFETSAAWCLVTMKPLPGGFVRPEWCPLREEKP